MSSKAVVNRRFEKFPRKSQFFYVILLAQVVFLLKGDKMRKTLIVGSVLILAAVWCVNAYAEGTGCPINGFFGSVGGFLYNALPWNWGNWMGK